MQVVSDIGREYGVDVEPSSKYAWVSVKDIRIAFAELSSPNLGYYHQRWTIA